MGVSLYLAIGEIVNGALDLCSKVNDVLYALLVRSRHRIFYYELHHTTGYVVHIHEKRCHETSFGELTMCIQRAVHVVTRTCLLYNSY